ncbi:MAG TPA: antitoxin Xre/MbcA/ParS toxin-binding domain-containing protein [Terriglobales bacterium]|jgi:putative toxin-antitoxin system antitoxin component (TIGR02293 family)|nr:antitoxin Xre/MbcA/ParS toxin-binding domain-containing protein [Terriglobales bacterium]
MVSTERLVKTLGGLAVLKFRITTIEDLQKIIQAGLPYHALEAFMERFGLARTEVETVLGVPPRTMARRKRSRRLRPDESDRLIRLARLAAQAVQVFGKEDKAATWMHRPIRALGSQTPLDLLRTDLGAKQVEEVLGRIEHGVIS